MDLTDEQLINPARNSEFETQTQYKARRRILKAADDLYLKKDFKGFKTSYIEFIRLCFKLSVKKND